MDAHDIKLVKAAKASRWEDAMGYLTQVHSDEAYNIINDYCRSQYHRYED